MYILLFSDGHVFVKDKEVVARADRDLMEVISLQLVMPFSREGFMQGHYQYSLIS